MESVAIKHFNRIYKSELSECVSFFVENTLADDDTPIYVDTISQTIESGGVLLDKQSQTLKTDLKFNSIFTENKLSIRTPNLYVCEFCDTSTNTIITYENKTGNEMNNLN